MIEIGSSVNVKEASVKEQRLFRRLLHEHGFKINTTHMTGVYYDDEGRRYFDFPDAFWMKPDEMEELNGEFASRRWRA